MVSQVEVRVVGDEVHDLAEGPWWDAADDRLLWVDIPEGVALEGRLSPSGVEVVGRHAFPGTVGAVVPTVDGGLLVAAQRGPAWVDPDGGVTIGRELIPAGVASRLNDATCDPAGRLLVGSLALDGRTDGERLYRVDADGTSRVLDEGFTLSNGLGFSPDGSTLYHVDSVPGIVWVRDYDVGTGDMGPRREAFRPAGGLPDGLCVDADGQLWIAMWGAGEVRRYRPDGHLLTTVHVPAPHTTSMAFVGPEHDQLLITTAREQLTGQQLADFPASGRLFLAEVGVRGQAGVPWAGRSDDAGLAADTPGRAHGSGHPYVDGGR